MGTRSMISCITLNSSSRVALASCRNAFNMVANLSLYVIAFEVFNVNIVRNYVDVENEYRWIAYLSIVIGCCFVGIFLIATKEPRLKVGVQGKVNARISWVYWFKRVLYYQVAFVYTLTRLIVNVSQAYLAFFVINDLRMGQSAKALVPAIIYIFSFIVSILLQEIAWTGPRRKAYFSAGGIIWTLCGVVVLLLPRHMSYVMYIASVLIGIAYELIMVTGVSMQHFLIGEDLNGCAFVCGSLSFLVKMSCGIALYILQSFQKKKTMEITDILPKELICKIISVTTLKDACRLSVVSSAFKELADSDDIWQAVLPSDWQDLIAQSLRPDLISLTKKQVYLHLSDHPLLLANRTMSFSLAKESGKKCYMIGARGLGIAWGDTPSYWNWVSFRHSRFAQVAELQYVWWFDVRGALNTRLLSPGTRYEVWFMFRFGRGRSGFTDNRVNVSLTSEGGVKTSTSQVVLDPPAASVIVRDDGGMEFKIGDFLTLHEEDDDASVSFRVWETNNNYTKNGILLEGVDFRPTS